MTTAADPPEPAGGAEELDALVENLLGRTPRPVAWQRLTADQTTDQLDVLDTWVRWLAGRYGLDHRDIPACWHHHGALVEELAALRTAHQAAYDPAGDPRAPADWHHTLAAARGRCRDWVARTGCRAGHHHTPPPPTPTADPWIDDPWIDDNGHTTD